MKQTDNIQEATRDLFCNDYCEMFVFSVPLTLNIPVLDSTNDVTFVSFS